MVIYVCYLSLSSNIFMEHYYINIVFSLSFFFWRATHRKKKKKKKKKRTQKMKIKIKMNKWKKKKRTTLPCPFIPLHHLQRSRERGKMMREEARGRKILPLLTPRRRKFLSCYLPSVKALNCRIVFLIVRLPPSPPPPLPPTFSLSLFLWLDRYEALLSFLGVIFDTVSVGGWDEGDVVDDYVSFTTAFPPSSVFYI